MSTHIGAASRSMGRLKSRFVRALVETLQQETAGTALPRLRHGLPAHWLRVLSREVIASTDQDATLALDTAIDLLLAIERLLSAGTGKVMVAAAASLATRVLYGSPGLVVHGDTVRTLRHLRAPFEQPYLGVDLRFAVDGSQRAFALELALAGLPTAAPWLTWTGLGYLHAASAFSGHDPAHLRVEPLLSGELVRISARRAQPSTAQLPASAAARPQLRSTPVRRRTAPTNAAARVEQILSRAQSARAAESQGTPAMAAPLPASAPARTSSAPPSSAAASSTSPAQSGTRPAVGSSLQQPRKSAR